MQLIEGRLGDAEGITISPNTFRVSVALASPATHVRALLRGFDIGFRKDSGDRHIQIIRAEVEALAGRDSRHVDIIGKIEVRDKDPDSNGPLGLIVDTATVACELHFTLIAE